VNKDEISKRLSDIRDNFTKSISPVRNLVAGTILTEDMLTLKKPGTGIPVEEKSKIVGKMLICDVSADHLLKWEDIGHE
jgi:N,N'-diacetyllegionaminate synthase